MPYKDKLIKDIPRFCKYIHCRKLLPKDCHHQKRYCIDTDCFYLQNQLEAKEKRDAIKAEKSKKFRICNFGECGKEFEVDPKAPLKVYCDEKCRDANHAKGQKKRYEERMAREVKKPKDSGLPEWTQVRGNITNSNTGWMGSINA